jgi:alkylation response protein AidB-like acyl-CoA dehydrogenase
MDFSFTSEQTLLRESVRKFVEKSYGFEARRSLMNSELGFSRDHWKSFAELGWTAIPFSEADGGLGGSAIDTMIVLEELGKGLVLEPYFATVVLSGGFLRRASGALKEKYLTPLISGELIAATAYAEQDSRFDLFHVGTTAKKSGNEYVLDGKKIAVLAGHAADVLIVSARTSGNTRDAAGITLFAVDAKSAGVSRKGYRTVDGLHGADITLQGVKVSADAIVGTLDDGLSLLDAATDEAIIGLGAEAMGLMDVLYKSTVAYTKERKQFGVPIGSFQVLQHRMVDQFMEAEQARSMVYYATMTLAKAKSAADIAKAASGLKVQIGKSGRFVGQAAIQNHGGMGMTDELAVSHFFKRMTMIDLMLGNVDHHLDRYRSL